MAATYNREQIRAALAQTDPALSFYLDLDTGLGRSNITYTVSAVTLGADDKTSETAKITLKR